jgi:hypothetical protein
VLDIHIRSAVAHTNAHRESSGLKPLRARPLLVVGADLKSEAERFFHGLGYRIPGADPSLSGAAAVAELGDSKLLAGETADLATSAPAYGRAPNARKPAR